jgi:hypothetical protein
MPMYSVVRFAFSKNLYEITPQLESDEVNTDERERSDGLTPEFA